MKCKKAVKCRKQTKCMDNKIEKIMTKVFNNEDLLSNLKELFEFEVNTMDFKTIFKLITDKIFMNKLDTSNLFGSNTIDFDIQRKFKSLFDNMSNQNKCGKKSKKWCKK